MVPGAVPAASPGTVPAIVVDATFLGSLTDCHAALPDGTRVRVQLDPGRAVEVGQAVRLGFDPVACSVFDIGGERE